MNRSDQPGQPTAGPEHGRGPTPPDWYERSTAREPERRATRETELRQLVVPGVRAAIGVQRLIRVDELGRIPRDAVGATVSLTAGGVRQRCDVLSGGSFSSSNDQRVHFGLGQNTVIEKLEIHWPSGAVQRLNLASIDRFYVVEEGKGIVPGVYDQSSRKSQQERPSDSDKIPAVSK